MQKSCFLNILFFIRKLKLWFKSYLRPIEPPILLYSGREKKIICIAYSWISEFHSRQTETWVPRSSKWFLYIGIDVSLSHLHQGHTKLSTITNLCIIQDFEVRHRFRKQAYSFNAFIWLNMTLQILSTIKDSIRQDYWGTNM